MSRPLAALLGLILVSAPALAHAQDASVKRRLEDRGVKYQVDTDGDFKITYNYKSEGRTQLVFVSGGTESVGGFLVREIFSPAGRLDQDGINGAKALELLKESSNNKLGSWEIRGDALYFVIKLPDGVNGGELESAMDIAAEIADNMEKELSGTRDAL
jgi:hypothetical protein